MNDRKRPLVMFLLLAIVLLGSLGNILLVVSAQGPAAPPVGSGGRRPHPLPSPTEPANEPRSGGGEGALILTSPGLQQFSCASVTEIPQRECEALVALYNATDGPNWADNTNWLATSTPSDWYGVTVDAGHVIQLDLEGNQLSGPIPPELGSLANL